jgi:hypothetical protein
MDKPEDTKDPTKLADSSASASIAEPKIDLLHIDAPSIVPAAGTMADAGAASAPAPKPATAPAPAAPAAPTPVAPAAAAAVSAGAASLRRRRSIRKLAPLALVLASAVGATAGALAPTGIAKLAPLVSGPSATAEEPMPLPATLAQMRAEIAALKTSTEAGSRNATVQFARLSERLDRIERTQMAAAAKADMSAAREATAALAPPPPPAQPLPPVAAPPSTPVPGWVLRDVYRGAAILQSRTGGLIEVGPGDILPGVGRIEAVRRQDGHWVVITQKGIITSMR